tara:strand:- start:1566 stop:1958 length:393 start_codon:yes stop_codon:yes gene_type:complete
MLKIESRKQGYILAGVILFLDQLTKLVMQNVYYIQNTGAAWGILKDSKLLLIVVPLIVLFYAHRYFSYHPLAISLVLGGTLGNFFDRVLRGYVIDFINVYIFDFPLFNLADVCVTVGITMLCLKVLKEKK